MNMGLSDFDPKFKGVFFFGVCSTLKIYIHTHAHKYRKRVDNKAYDKFGFIPWLT